LFNRRRIPLAATCVGVLVLATAAAAAPNSFTAALAPGVVKPATAKTYTLTLTNGPASDHVQRAKVAIPAGFTDVHDVSANATGAGGCLASTWEPDGTLIAGGTINLKRPSGGGNRNLCPGATLTVVFTATSPTQDGSYTWSPELLAGSVEAETFTFTGDPTVIVDGTPPGLTINQTPSNPTNSRTAEFAFTASEATECKLDSAPFTTCTSPTTYSDLADGAHSFVVKATDAAGNTAEETYTWVVDTTAPTVSIDSGPPPLTNSRSASLSFSASEPTQCRLDDGAFEDCASPKAYSELADGEHTVTVKATDGVGNTSQDRHTWTVDATAPIVAITAAPPALTNSRSAGFSFTATEQATFQCKLDASAFVSCTSAKSYSDLGDGTHTFTVKATDAASNSAETSHTWTVDTTPPTVSINSGPSTLTNSRSASFTFTASEPTQCSVDEGSFEECASPKAYGELADGAHTFTVRAIDAAANVALASSTWTVDATAPVVQIIGDKPGDPTNSKSASFTFAASEPSTFRCTLEPPPAEPVTCASPTSYLGLVDGEHTFRVEARDQAGNTSQDSYAWTVDSEAPTVAIGEHPPTATTSRAATFSFTADAPTQCKLDAGTFADCGSPAIYSGLADGSHVFTVKATDTAGNTGQDLYQWTVDNVSPTVTIVQKPNDPSDSRSPTFAFIVNEGVVQCSLDGGAFAACASPKSYTNLADGPHTFTVKSTDAAGNIGQTGYSWRIETRLPVATLSDKPRNPSTSTSATFFFTSRPGATFECSLDGGAFAACTSPKEYGGLTQGAHTLAVRAKDGAGTGPATTYAWAIDSVGPAVAIGQGPGNPTNSRSASFAFSASEAASFACQLDGGGFGPCASPWSYHGLGDGAHTFTVRPTDTLGNVGATVLYTWHVDATVPETTLASRPASKTTATAATFTFSASEAAAFQCKLDAGAFAPCTSPKTHTGLTRTTHSFEVRAVDAAGNVDPTPAIHRWTVTRPVLRTRKAASALFAPAAGARVTRPPLLRWRRTPRASYYNVQLYRGSVKVLSAWPTTTRLQLKARWRHLGRTRRLTAGRYRWLVWPGFGKAAQRRYGRSLGASTFRVVSRARR
jgi:Bacterial Ig-like domain (group 3)